MLTCTECGRPSIYALNMCDSCCEAAGCFEPSDPDDALDQWLNDHTPSDLPERDLPCEEPTDWESFHNYQCLTAWGFKHPNAQQRRNDRRTSIPF